MCFEHHLKRLKLPVFITIAIAMKQVLIELIKGVVFSNLYVVFVVGALVWQTNLLVGTDLESDYLYFVMSATLFLYPFHRLIGAVKMAPNKRTERIQWAYDHQIAMVPLILCGAILSIYYFFQLESHIRWWIAPLAIISLAYSLPLPIKALSIRRLRDVPHVKIYAIAITVTMVTVIIPLVNADISSTEFALLIISRLILVIALTIPFDIRDVDLDRPFAIQTLALTLGVEKARDLAVLLMSVFTFTHFSLYFFFNTFSIYVFLALLISDIYAGYWLKKVKPNQPELFYVGAIEGVFIVQTLLVFAATLLP